LSCLAGRKSGKTRRRLKNILRINLETKKARTFVRACQFIRWKAKVNAMAQRQNEYVTIKAYNRRRIS
ncbi:hypothetical protein AXK64_20755, partial [Salmonella enterica subsp. enterica]|nr:hypothetical protein [Salmonella enterica subsp. enterica]